MFLSVSFSLSILTYFSHLIFENWVAICLPDCIYATASSSFVILVGLYSFRSILTKPFPHLSPPLSMLPKMIYKALPKYPFIILVRVHTTKKSQSQTSNQKNLTLESVEEPLYRDAWIEGCIVYKMTVIISVIFLSLLQPHQHGSLDDSCGSGFNSHSQHCCMFRI